MVLAIGGASRAKLLPARPLEPGMPLVR